MSSSIALSVARQGGSDENMASSDWSPAVDIRETDENFQIDLEIAGDRGSGRQSDRQGRRAFRHR